MISGRLNVAAKGDFRLLSDYAPGYADLSASERRAYLDWMAEGRSHPDCAIGYVFIFFYGLERRVILDGPADPTSKADWPDIKAELRKLDGLYGNESPYFRRHVNDLLDWMELDALEDGLYRRPLPSFSKNYELPRYLRLALGQCSVDRAPIPAPLALAWLRLSPDVYLRTPATRCEEEFDQLFEQRYREALKGGLVLPKNKTKLKFVYQPASYGMRAEGPFSKTFGDVPDVTVLTAPIKKLAEIAQQCTDELNSFSRLVGKNPSARHSLDGLLQLPTSIWPPEAKARLETVASQLGSDTLSLSMKELVNELGGSDQPLNRDKALGLARALGSFQIGMEPNVLQGAKTPGEEDPVVLFPRFPGDLDQADTGAYQTAMLTLQLASTVANADGDFSESEMEHLRREVDSWEHLSLAERRRLHAHLQWLSMAPISLTSLKKKLEPLGSQAKETLATSMAALVQADGIVSPEEMKFLEKVYKTLGVETKRVFSDVHAVTSGVPRSTVGSSTGFRLDPKRVAQLQQDTDKVSALLSDIFKEEEPQAHLDPSESTIDARAEPSLLGLDEPHAALARLMLSRPQWERSELEDSAVDLELMLDGALEQINEASFDAHGFPFSEGDDPVEINPEFIEMIEQ